MTISLSLPRTVPQRRWPVLTLVVCGLTTGCQTPGFKAALAGKETPTQPVSSTEDAGLPEPTNTASSNSPLSLSSVDEHLRLGEEELAKGNLRQAQIHFDHVLEQNPDHVNAHHRLGVLADKLSQFDQAEQHYLTALNGDPRNASLLSDLGYSYFMQGRHADAERYLLEARKVDPGYETAIANLGLLYGSTGRKQEAMAMFRQIGDDQQVEEIMQQIAGGEFGPTGRVASNPRTQQSSAITRQMHAQQQAPSASQQSNGVPQDFLEELRRAREELQRAEQELALHRQAQGTTLVQAGGTAQSMPQQPWAPQTPAPQPAAWQNQQPPVQQQQPPQSFPAQAMAQIPQPEQAPPTAAPMASQQPAAGGPLPTVTPAGKDGFLSADNVAVKQQSANGSSLPSQHGGLQAQPGMSGSPSPQQPGMMPSHSAQPHPAAGWQQQNPQAAAASPQTDMASANGPGANTTPRSAWGQQYSAAVDQQLPQIAGQPAAAVQQMSGNAQTIDQQPVQHAHHNQSPQHGQNIALASQQGAVDPAHDPRAWNAQPAGGTAPATSRNAYDTARREAALMGLHAGPGQVFPYIQQSPQPTPHGDPRMNGAVASAPAQPTQARPVPPPTIQPGPRQDQYPYQQTAPQQQQSAPQQQPAQSYQQQAPAQQPQQPAAQPSQAWGQAPQSQSYPTTSTSTTRYYESATTPTAQSDRVISAPYYERSTSSSAGQTTPVGYQTNHPLSEPQMSQATNGVVVPEPYSRRQPMQASSMQQPQVQQLPQQQQMPPARPYSGPMIVPGEQR